MRQMVIERSAIAGQSDCLPSALVVGRSPPGAPAVNSPMDGIRVIGAPKSRTMLPRYDSEITLEVVTARRDSSPLAELLPSDNCWPRSSRPSGVQRIHEIRQRLPVEPARFEHSKAHALQFGRFSLIKHSRQLLAGGTPVRLGNRAIDVLFVLIEASGQLVTKDELMSRAWPTVTVEAVPLYTERLTTRLPAVKAVCAEAARAAAPSATRQAPWRSMSRVARFEDREPIMSNTPS